jgi:hypothetical protein
MQKSLGKKRPLGIDRCKYEDNAKMNPWEGMEWIHIAQHRVHWKALVNMAMNFKVPQTAWNFFTT